MPIRLLEIRTGQVRTYPKAGGGTWTSAIRKEAVPGPVRLTALGLEGDAVAATKLHGGPDQAVLAYASEHYAAWRAEGFEAGPGAFGENLVLEGLTDQEACIGDVYAFGEVQFQVSHPRQPCATLATSLGRGDIVPRVWILGRGGWYLRVLKEGSLAPGLAGELLRRPNPGATVARVLAAFDHAGRAPQEARLMADAEGLTGEWREKLRRKAGA